MGASQALSELQRRMFLSNNSDKLRSFVRAEDSSTMNLMHNESAASRQSDRPINVAPAANTQSSIATDILQNI